MHHFLWRSWEKKNSNLDYGSYSRKNIHEMSYRLESSMAFISNKLGYSQRECIVYRNEAMSRTWSCHVMGINAVCGFSPFCPCKTHSPYFRVTKCVFCLKQVHGRTRVEGSLCITIDEHIRNPFDTPAPCASSLGSRRILHHLPPM